MTYSRNVSDMYRRDRHHCRFCKTTHNLTPHHIVFRSQGGTDDLSNLLTLCMRCHDGVHGGKLRITVLEDGEVIFRRVGSW
jgi:5-methylcytosine-specific restriction endonuclease McrA